MLAFYPPTRFVSIPFFVLGAFVLFFFRDPDRTPPSDPGLWVSPADGKVVHAGPEPEGGTDRMQVSIFLSLFDVHINRSPVSGVITDVVYTPGKFLPAYRDQASRQNERNQIELADGALKVTVRQIAGVAARRIVFFKKKNDRLDRGERFGLIQFGSRVEVLFPSEVKLRVSLGDRVKGGESVIAEKP